MFEALNTTGEPLSALETFVPQVIQAEGLGNYDNSPSYEPLELIRGYLDSHSLSEKHAANRRLLIPFALAETGYKLPGGLSEQRQYLREQYEPMSLPEKRAFLGRVAHGVSLVSGAWADEPQFVGLSSQPSSEERFCIAALRALKHDIVLGPMLRFYSNAVVTQDDDSREQIGLVLRSCVAFFSLWRFAFGSTARIDERYRQVMREGLALHPEVSGDEAPSVVAAVAESVTGRMREFLAEANIGKKAQWTSRASSVPIGSADNSSLARLLLLAALHDTVDDTDSPPESSPCSSWEAASSYRGKVDQFLDRDDRAHSSPDET